MNSTRAHQISFRDTHHTAFRCAVIAVVAVFAFAVLPMSKVVADPTLSEAEKKVAQLSKQMEIATEQYNDAREALKQSKAKIAALKPQAQKLQADVTTVETKLAEFASNAYYGGRISAFSSILDSGSPRTFLDQVSFLEEISARQRADLTVLTTSRAKLDETKSKLDAELAKQTKAEKTLRTKRESIKADLAKWEDLRSQLTVRSSSVPLSNYSGPATGKALMALKFAYAQLGKSYVWGAAGPSTYDCSGLTMAAWAAAGVGMAHSATMQFNAFPQVSLSELRPGDLVFYGSPIHHVAMYVGGGNVIHAPQAGDVVRIAPTGQAGGSAIAGAVRPA